MGRHDPKFREAGQERDVLYCQGKRDSIGGGIQHPTHPHSEFCQLLDVFLTLQVLELVAELIIDTVVNKKP